MEISKNVASNVALTEVPCRFERISRKRKKALKRWYRLKCPNSKVIITRHGAYICIEMPYVLTETSLA